MKKRSITSHSREETIIFGADFGSRLVPGEVVCLFGDLGSGKTTFVKGIARGMRINARKVHSPTFTLMNVYEGSTKVSLFHFDLYRLENEKEILNLDYDEYLFGQGVAVIEWAEKLGSLMPEKYYAVNLSHKGENIRKIAIEPKKIKK